MTLDVDPPLVLLDMTGRSYALARDRVIVLENRDSEGRVMVLDDALLPDALTLGWSC